MERVRLQVLVLESRICPAITIRIDYSFDTGFFADPARRAALERAADVIDSRLQDTLAAIVPDPAASRTWNAITFNPITGSNVVISNPVIAANEIVVYAAGGPIPGSTLAVASGGGWSTGPFFIGDPWPDIIRGRGQPGALATPASDFSPWGGFLAFDSTSAWNFSIAPPGPGQNDFESVALHELVHMLGFGLDNVGSYSRWIQGNQFMGPNAMAVHGGPVPLEPGNSGHWAPSVTSGGQTAIMVSALTVGTRRGITPLDWAALADIGWQISPPPPPPPPAGAPGPVQFHVGSGTGRPSLVAGLNADGGTVWNHSPFGTFSGGVRVATGDFNLDGVPDVVVGTGPGTPAQVQVLDGVTRKTLFSISPFGTFTGGVYVAAGDVTGDGRPELIISPDRGGGPRVRIFNGNGFGQISDWFGIDDVNFRGGARVAVGDINGDGRNDVIVAAGFGGGPRVAVFDGKQLGLTGGPKFFGDFFAFEQTLRNGAFVAAGDLDGDGKAELIAGGGPGGGPRVSAFSGALLMQSQQVRIADFFADQPTARGGVRLAAFDRNGDGRDDILAGSGENFGSRIALFDGKTAVGAASPAPVWQFDYFNDLGGIFVG